MFDKRASDGTIAERVWTPPAPHDTAILSNESLPDLGDENFVRRGYLQNRRGIIKCAAVLSRAPEHTRLRQRGPRWTARAGVRRCPTIPSLLLLPAGSPVLANYMFIGTFILSGAPPKAEKMRDVLVAQSQTEKAVARPTADTFSR